MILSTFYKAIKDRLIPPGGVDDIGLKFFNLWSNQIVRNEDDEDDLFFNYPAAFLKFDPIEWQTLGRKKQSADATFTIILASENFHETSSLDDAAEIDNGLAHLEMIDKIFARLQGFNGNGFGSISRTGTAYEHDAEYTELIVHEIPFKVRLEDVAAMIEMQSAQPQLDTTTNIVTSSVQL